jgi:hypothetical protein
MKTHIMVAGLIIVVIVVLVGLATSGVFTSPYFQEKTQFGEFGQNIRVLYDDGTSESLSILENKPLSVVTYGGKSITGFDYTLNVKASGTGYTDATVTLGTYNLVASIASGGATQWSYSYPLVSGANTIPFDSTFHPIGGTATIPVKTKMDMVALSTGIYVVTFTPSGTVTYNGNPGGASSTVAMPAAVTCQVNYVPGISGSVSIVITGGPIQY